MNELEKQEGLTQDPELPASTEAETEKECVEKACVETESPAESISEATDELAPELEAPLNQDDAAIEEAEVRETPRRYHSMTKEELVAALKDVLDTDNMEAHKEVGAMKQAFFNIRSRESLDELNAFIEDGNSPDAFAARPDELEGEFKTLYANFKERRQAYLQADEEKRKENLAKKMELLEKMNVIAGDIDNVNVKFSEFQQLQQDFRAIKEIPASAETETWKNFQTVCEQYYDHLKMNKELRDLDFKKNLEVKRQLLDQAKALADVADPVLAFRQLQGLHDEWRNIGPVAKEVREELWEEFREASAVVNRRHQEYFEKRKAAEQINEDAKTSLCEEVEAIDHSKCTSFSAWNQATDKVIELQKRWKEFGYASKKANTALYARFRKACDDFFEAKTEFFRRTRENFSENLEKKIALCERAEALKNNPDVKNPTDEIVKLQAEWKKIGSVPRKQSDEVWARFQEACNYFFDERKRQNRERRKEENSNLETKRQIIASLNELPLDGDRREVMAVVKELQAKWNETGFIPFKLKDQIFKEYRAICDRLYDTYNSRESRQRMNNWRDRMGKMRGDGQKVLGERDKLVRALEGRRGELANFENNMGFFNVKSSAGNALVRDMERKMARLRDEIAEIENKIRIIDNPEVEAVKESIDETCAVEGSPAADIAEAADNAAE